MMTRDDVLKELELLPIWRLRAPLTIKNQPDDIVTAEKLSAETVPAAPAENIQKTETEFDFFQSENNAYIFICAQNSMPEILIDIGLQGMLFDNILKALQIKAKKTLLNFADSALQNQAKVIVAMGEKTAQTLLNSSESIANLRGKQHVLHGLPLIVTFSAAEMLEHLPNKAKAWHDLCTALRLVNA